MKRHRQPSGRSAPAPAPPPTGRTKGGLAAAAVFLAALTVAICAPGLFGGPNVVLSRPAGDDIAQQFLAWREFAFQAMRSGHVPFWNPRYFCGAPCAADVQSALFYPPNWLFLVLPVAAAINGSIALHLFLSGFFTALWASRRGLSGMASALSGALFLCSGAVVYQMSDGYLTAVDAIAWVPLALLATDALIETGDGRACLPGAAALALQILAGHPQTAYLTILAMAVYTALRLPGTRRRIAAVAGWAAMCTGAAALSAVQTLTTLRAAEESTRGHASLSFTAAAAMSFPPRNLITTIVPGFYGGGFGMTYWGQWHTLVWVVIPYIGAVGLMLAALGARRGPPPARAWTIAAAVMLVVALGRYTPVFALLYHAAPGFALFRAPSRALVQFALFASLLAGQGFDALAARPLSRRGVAMVSAVAGLCGCGGAWLLTSALTLSVDAWHAFMMSQYGPFGIRLAYRAALATGAGLISTAALLAAAAVLMGWRMRSSKVQTILAVVAIGEVAWFAHSLTPTCTLAQVEQPAVEAFLHAHAGDYRILDEVQNNDFHLSADDISGYNPLLLGRYADLIAGVQRTLTQPADPREASQVATLLRMLRCRYVFGTQPRVDAAGQAVPDAQVSDPLPHALLVSHWTVAPDGSSALAGILDRSFDPRQAVVLEGDPGIAQGGGGAGPVDVRVVDSDTLSIEATTAAPAILLITDAYASGWEATGRAGSAQRAYRVMPADYVLRAIPLDAGTHHIVLQYRPRGYAAGLWITAVSTVVLAALALLALRQGPANGRAGLARSSEPEPIRQAGGRTVRD